MPKVSVIIPNFNHATYLPQRIESVLQQTFRDFELIVLDDASTDNSREIIRSYADKHPHIKTVFNEKNSGSPFAQWNRGAEIAEGEYLWFAESDDYCDKRLLESLVPMMDEHPRAGLGYCQTYLVNEENEILNSYGKNLEFIYKSKAWTSDFVKDGTEVCREWMLFHNPIPNASGALMRKSIFVKAGMADPGMSLNGDWFLYAKIMAISDLAFTAEHLNYFRVHPHTQRERARATPKVYQEIITINRFIQEHVPKSEENAREALRRISHWWEGSLYYQEWNRPNFNLNLELYRFFKAYRNLLFWHIMYVFVIELTRSFMRFTGILKPAKKVRKWLFPGKYFEY